MTRCCMLLHLLSMHYGYSHAARTGTDTNPIQSGRTTPRVLFSRLRLAVYDKFVVNSF